MQTISKNAITQGQHGQYNAVDIGPSPDPYYYAPEDGIITVVDNVDDDTCGKRLKLKGATGEHGFCHNDTIYVSVGQTVKRGQKLAKMGYTGYTQPDNVPAGTHVHWVLSINGVWVYPLSRVNEIFKKEGEGEPMPTPAQIDDWISKQHFIAFGKPASPEVFNSWRPTLKNNFIDGSLGILSGIDSNAGALKNQPAGEFEELTFKTFKKKG